ncbi:MAG: (p)ppGpp synthetase, partial [Clostridia bacterium]|nr:(p)ppGpp synthetase [Clostridia bacterium]
KGYYLIVNNGRERMVSIKVFPGVEKGLEAATKAYNEFEMTKTKEDDAVLVSAQSYESLVFAYPNYFSDIREFTNKIIEINDKVINSSE